MDYEFDSDDEWEDEPDDAEEIENSDGVCNCSFHLNLKIISSTHMT